jgi:hypothetical protein
VRSPQNRVIEAILSTSDQKGTTLLLASIELTLAMSSMMLVGLASAVLWRVFGLNTIINETVPSIIIALLFHEILIKIYLTRVSHE